MTPETLFGELLGLGIKWRVTKCVFYQDRSQVDLQLEHTNHVWKLERCPKCGTEAKGCDRTASLRWRHLNVMQYRCKMVACLPRGRCPKCNPTWRVRPPCEVSARSLRPSPCSCRARWPSSARPRRLGNGSVPVASDAPARGRGLCRGGLFAVICVGVDEMAVRKGHQYISGFADLIQKRVLFAAEDRDSGVFPQLIEALEPVIHFLRRNVCTL